MEEYELKLALSVSSVASGALSIALSYSLSESTAFSDIKHRVVRHAKVFRSNTVAVHVAQKLSEID